MQALGAFQAGAVSTAEIPFDGEVRALCEKNSCRNYGKTWACPPAVGSLQACEDFCLRYDFMFVFTKKYDLEDSFDFEGMREGLLAFKNLCDRVASAFPGLPVLSNEGCHRCDVCTYPDAPCRFPDKLLPALEGFGILVGALAKKAGVNYINGQEHTVTTSARCSIAQKALVPARAHKRMPLHWIARRSAGDRFWVGNTGHGDPGFSRAAAYMDFDQNPSRSSS
jgi:predicted metal-binding protein